MGSLESTLKKIFCPWEAQSSRKCSTRAIHELLKKFFCLWQLYSLKFLRSRALEKNFLLHEPNLCEKFRKFSMSSKLRVFSCSSLTLGSGLKKKRESLFPYKRFNVSISMSLWTLVTLKSESCKNKNSDNLWYSS